MNLQSDSKRIASEVAASLTLDSWEKMRATSLAGAGVCTALILFVLQDPGLRSEAAIPLLLAACSLPLHLAAAFMVENYVTQGERSYKNLRSAWGFWIMALAFFVGAGLLVASFFMLIHLYFPSVAFVFLAMSALCFFLTMWHQTVTKTGA